LNNKTPLQIFIVAFASLIYAVTFIPIFRQIGFSAGAPAIILVILVGWFWGMRAGLIAGLLSVPLNLMLYKLAGLSFWETFFLFGGWMASLVVVISGVVVGRMKDLDEELRRQVEKRKYITDKMRQSERKFKIFVESLHDVIFELSPTGEIEYVNPNVQENFGYKPEDLLGRHFNKTTPPDEIPKALEILKQVMSGSTIRNFEINQLDINGKVFPTEVNISPMRKGDIIIGALGVMRNISERKEVEIIIDLKKEVNSLLNELGRQQKYRI
jgi:PAS domain S-box-containing protein